MQIYKLGMFAVCRELHVVDGLGNEGITAQDRSEGPIGVWSQRTF